MVRPTNRDHVRAVFRRLFGRGPVDLAQRGNPPEWCVQRPGLLPPGQWVRGTELPEGCVQRPLLPPYTAPTLHELRAVLLQAGEDSGRNMTVQQEVPDLEPTDYTP